MRVYFGIVRQLIVDYVGNIIYVYTTRSYIGSYDALKVLGLEALQHFGSHLLVHIAMQRTGRVAHLHQLFANVLRILFCTGKYDTIYARSKIKKATKGFKAVVVVGHVILVVYIFVGRIRGSHRKLFPVFHEAFGDAAYFIAHCSAKKPCVFTRRGILQYQVYIFTEAHVQHFISFIQHHKLQVFK